jgi:hypothetical protein
MSIWKLGLTKALRKLGSRKGRWNKGLKMEATVLAVELVLVDSKWTSYSIQSPVLVSLFSHFNN